MDEIKVFEINDCDWWAGYDLESCIVAAMKATGMDRDELIDEKWDDPHELTNEEMNTRKFCDEDGTVRTFKEQLDLCIRRGEVVPCLFASTEY